MHYIIWGQAICYNNSSGAHACISICSYPLQRSVHQAGSLCALCSLPLQALSPELVKGQGHTGLLLAGPLA
jgi:hypothetical protein